MNYTKKAFEGYLNRLGAPSDDSMVIGGKLRHGNYGTALRRHDPIQFGCAYNNWKHSRQR